MSGTNSLIDAKNTLAGGSESVLAEKLLNANEVAKKMDKKKKK